MSLREITDCFFQYAQKKGNPYESFPLSTEVEEFGSPYIEILEDGKMAIVARERGEECFRKETRSSAELARWVYEMFNKS